MPETPSGEPKARAYLSFAPQGQATEVRDLAPQLRARELSNEAPLRLGSRLEQEKTQKLDLN